MIKSYGINKSYGVNKLGLIYLITNAGAPVIPASRIITDGADIMYRKWIQGGLYVIDYSGDGGGTWLLAFVTIDPLEEDNIVMDIDAAPAGYRDRVRDGAYVIDHEIQAPGFLGVEDQDWEQVYYTKPIL